MYGSSTTTSVPPSKSTDKSAIIPSKYNSNTPSPAKYIRTIL